MKIIIYYYIYMPEHYGDEKQEKKSTGKLTDKQKADLKKHMAKHSKDMTASEIKSHRMKMMTRMRKGMSINKAHKDIMK